MPEFWVGLVQLFILAAFTFLASAGGASQDAQVLATFSLQDYLNHDWRTELVFFKVAAQLTGRTNLELLDAGQHSIPYQWATDGKAEIAFLASVPKLAKAEYTLKEGRSRDREQPAVRDLSIKDQAESVELTNEKIGIRLNKGSKGLTQGPIGGVRLTSSKWVGDGEMHWPADGYIHLGAAILNVKIVANGPVFTEAVSEYTFPDKGYWRLRFRLIAGEPVILVDEEFSGPADAWYRFKMGAGFEPDHLFWRKDAGSATGALKDLTGESVFLLEPWLEWWNSMCGNWLAVYRDDSPNLLAVGLRDPACWVEPGKMNWRTKVDVAKTDLTMKFQLRGFERKWMFMALPKEDALRPVKDTAPLTQQYLMKHGEVQLNEIKDYVLEWPDAGLQYPRLYLTKEELGRFRSKFEPDQRDLGRLRGNAPSRGALDDYVLYALATGDQQLLENLAQFAVGELQECVDLFVKQNRHPTQGYAPHKKYDQLVPTLNALDAVMQPGVLAPEVRTRVRAQLAYLGYTLASPSFHSPERGFNANPNMTTSARCMSGLIACLIPDHPEARNWAQLGIHEMAGEFETWTGPDGGWLEAPHYATVSLDALIGLALALRQTPFTDVDWIHHPKLKGAVRWLACISSPRDARLNGERHMPEIGNTYTGERTCLTGLMARIWRDQDPAFAKTMQWIWKEQGAFTKPGIGGLYPALMGYSAFMLDPAIPAEAPAWGSEWFPEAGVVFRAHFPGDSETYLHYIEGRLHQHYDYDEGSFILWGKGQPLCEDFGYYGRAPASDHSRVAYASDEELGSEGKVREFSAGERLDYLHGERPNWNRQILFVKDQDPLGPNYFVIRDTLKNARTADWRKFLPVSIGTGPDWRVWIATDGIPGAEAAIAGAASQGDASHSLDSSQPIRVPGRFGVDLVVYFVETSGGKLSTEAISRTNGASGFKSLSTTQHSLHLRLGENDTVSAVLYPVTRAQATPKFTRLADGRAVKIESSYGTDYAFLALEPFDFKQGDIKFRSQGGAVQERPDGTHLSLSGQGQLRDKGEVVTRDK